MGWISPARVGPWQLVLAAALCGGAPSLVAQGVILGGVSSGPGPAPVNMGQMQPADEGPQQPDNSTTTRMTGVVVNALDGKPVARVLVTSIDRRFAAMTDSEGRFSFDLKRPATSSNPSAQPLPGVFSLTRSAGATSLMFRVTRPGYVSGNVNAIVASTRPDAPETTLQLKITPAASIAGHVEMPTSDSTVRIMVQLQQRMMQDGSAVWRTTAGQQASSRGEFHFGGLQAGDYKLMCPAQTLTTINRAQADSVPGTMPTFYPDAGKAEDATPIHLNVGETATANIAPRTATFYRVTVPIAGMDGSRNMGATLLPESMGFSIGIDQRDHALTGDLPTGQYTARLQVFGQQGQPAQSAVVHFEVQSAPLKAAPVTPITGADIAVEVREDFTSGQQMQTQMNGRAILPVYVNLTPLDGEGMPVGMMPSAQPNAPPDMTLRGVAPGRYNVRINATRGYVAFASSGTTDLLREPLTVSDGGTAPIEVTLRDDIASLSGRITMTSDQQAAAADDSRPILVMGIPLDRPGAQPLMSGSMAMPGAAMPMTFQLGGVAPGRYLMIASRQQIFQTLEYRNPQAMQALMTQGAVVTLAGGDKGQVDVPLMNDDAVKGN